MTIVLGGVWGLSGPTAAASAKPRPNRAGPTVLTVDRKARERTIPHGFLGLSFEYMSLERFTGTNPGALDPVFLQLVRNLTPGQRPVIRIGGGSTDHTWLPVPHMRKPGGVSYSITQQWLSVARSMSRVLNARMIFGINFEADSRKLASAEANALVKAVGPARTAGVELGNEPELYGSWGWYTNSRGVSVKGRPPNYDLSAFTRDFVNIARGLPGPIAGPTIGGIGWFVGLANFLAAEPRIRLVTLHRYPTLVCYEKPSSPYYPTIPHLLLPQASRGLAQSVATYVALSHAHHLPLRIDEFNAISCGWMPQVGYSFASALWALDTLFEMANVGVDGVNVHTYPPTTDELWQFNFGHGRWHGQVEPEYYGLLMFARAAPAGSTLLKITGKAGRGIHVWATLAPGGSTRVLLINDLPQARTFALKIPGVTGPGSIQRLQAPTLASKKGVTLGGQSLGGVTKTGVLAPPIPASVTRTGGRYVVKLPAGSATLVTFG